MTPPPLPEAEVPKGIITLKGVFEDLYTESQMLQYAKDYHAALSDERIMEVARRHWKMPGNDVIAFVRELLG